MLLHVVADFGTGDLAFAEVAQRFALHLPEARVWPTAVPPFATVTAGFLVAQLALGDGPADRPVFHNVAPRRDNGGERLVHARLPKGVQAVGALAGHAVSFLAEAGAELRWFEVPSAGSQFRSRDPFPVATARALVGEDLAPPVLADRVPPVPRGLLAYVDGFGNLKTTVDAAEAPPPGAGSPSRTAGWRSRPAAAAGGSRAVASGAGWSCSCAAAAPTRRSGDPRSRTR